MLRALGCLPGGLGRFLPCRSSAHHCRIRSIGWEQCGHGLTSRPLEPSGAGHFGRFALSDPFWLVRSGRYCSSTFSTKKPAWGLQHNGGVATLVAGAIRSTARESTVGVRLRHARCDSHAVLVQLTMTAAGHQQEMTGGKTFPKTCWRHTLSQSGQRTQLSHNTEGLQHQYPQERGRVSPSTPKNKATQSARTVEYTFIQKRFHPVTLSSKTLSSNFDTFIQNSFIQ